MRLLFLALSGLFLAVSVHAESPLAAPPGSKAVLITGASSGIGRKSTEYLAAKGYFVFACARKQEDLDALGKIANVMPLKLDVTKQEDIDAAVTTVRKSGRKLYALVNNAGIATVGSMAETTMKEFDLVMQVNVYGPYRVTKAFAPLLLENEGADKGRITTISSISGILSARDFSAYSMSKHAVESFGDSLALQLEPQGIRVSLIEPGNFDSDIGKSAAERTGQDSRIKDRSQYKKPDEVAVAIEQALFGEKPKRRYLVVPNLFEGEITIRKQIEQLVQLNEGHAFSYSREQLVKMLDEALVNSRPKP